MTAGVRESYHLPVAKFRIVLFRAGIGIAGIGVVLGVLVLVENLRGRAELRNARDTITATGESLDPSQLAPAVSEGGIANAEKLKTLAAEAVQAVKEAPITQLAPMEMQFVEPGKSKIMSRLPDLELLPLSGEKQAKGTWEDLAAEVAANAHLTAQAREILASPVEVSIDYSNLNERFGFFDNPLGITGLLRAETFWALHTGDLTLALDNLIALEQLANLSSTTPLLLSQTMATGIRGLKSKVIWEALHTDGWTEDQLSRLQDSLATGMSFAPFFLAIEMERATLESVFDALRTSSDGRAILFRNMQFDFMGGLFRIFAGQEDDQPEPSAFDIWARSTAWWLAWSHGDEATALRNYSDSLTRIRTLDTHGYTHVLKISPQKQDTGNVSWRFPVSESLLPASLIDSVLKPTARTVTMQRLAYTATALLRYRLQHGDYPDTLEELVPGFMPSVPLDPMDAQPLRYRKEGPADFTLYSIGSDGHDDGGNPAPIDEKKNRDWTQSKDIVWPAAI